MTLRITAVYLFLISCATDPASAAEQTVHYDSISLHHEDNQSYQVETDSRDPVSFEIRISNATNDTNCEKAFTHSDSTVSIKASTNRHFGFSRKGSPNIALYEWHMCFVHGETTYKAWRGFDPGPDSTLTVNCFIPVEQLAAKETDRYLCKTENVTHSESNYSEFAQHCWSEGVCRRFESESDYKLFLERGVDNVALYQISPTKKIRDTTINYEYFDGEPAEKLRSSLINERERSCAEGGEKYKVSCLKALSEFKASLAGDGDWRYQLTGKALIDSFSELKSQALVFQDTRGLDYETTFIFTPHSTNGNSVLFYSVECPHGHRQAKKALCTLSINQAFYSENPSEYFYIEKTSDVNTALWAYASHRGVEITRSDEGMARWLEQAHRTLSIEIGGRVAIFSYRSDACSYQVWYRIIGANEKLEYIKTSDDYCI